MTKISYEQITCPYLEKAYDSAIRQALSFNNWPYNLSHDAGHNQVSRTKTLTGDGVCSCGKKISVTLILDKIEDAKVWERVSGKPHPLAIYDTSSGKESVKVSGHPCSVGGRGFSK